MVADHCSNHDSLVAAVSAAIGKVPGTGPVCVAYSGGRDSMALLHAAMSAADGTRRVVALHVHHGLSPFASDWLSHCERECNGWTRHTDKPEFRCKPIGLERRPGDSIEAWAREGRYSALTQMAWDIGASAVLLGHHRRDQAETFLLQALRGGGVKGLASMPSSIYRGGLAWLRPLIAMPREAVEAYVARHELPFIDDESNAEPKFARNRLRLQAWDSLTAAFPQAEKSLADAAAWAQEAADALSELSDMDLAAVAGPQWQIDLTGFARLSTVRQSNLLRKWLHEKEGRSPSTQLVQRLVAELPGRHPAMWSTLTGKVVRYRGQLTFESHVDLAGEVVFERLPPGDSGGVPLALLDDARYVARHGGESFQTSPDRPARSLKKQFQAAAIEPWHRDAPLLYSGDMLVFVPGLGVDARALAVPGEPRVTLRWQSAAKMSGSAGN